MATLKGGEAYPIYFGASPELFRLAAELRHNQTPSERQLWAELRNRKLLGFKFRRQHPFNEIILDFYCHEARLSIEVDGDVHDDPFQKERDFGRSFLLHKNGVKELRFSNWEVENRMKEVVEKIKIHLQQLPSPSPMRGKGRDGGSERGDYWL